MGLLAMVAACGEEFTPYNEIEGVRLLAIGADPPWLAPSDTATISALVANRQQVPLRYSWSWCPFPAGSDVGFACAVSQADLQRMVDEAIGPGQATVPSYDLGSATEASFTYSMSPLLLRGVCEGLRSGELPDFVSLPECQRSFPITIRLVIRQEQREHVGIKELELLFEEGVTLNQNPMIGGLSALHPEEAATEITVEQDGSTALERDVEYTLQLAITATTAERFSLPPEEDGGESAQARERLVVSWFAEGGSLDLTRTSFVEGAIPLERARENLWSSPRVADFPETEARLFFVIRDGRGGVSWLARAIQLKE